jgi:hypothetical protein
MKLIYSLAVAAAYWLAIIGYAASIPVPNFSFENPDIADGGTTGSFDSIPGWSKSSGTTFVGVRDPLNVQYSSATGINAPLPGSGDGAQSAVMSAGEGGATLSTNVGTLAANTRYFLTVAVGNPLDHDPGPVRLGLTIDGSTAPTASTTILPGSIPDGTFTDFSVALGPFPSSDSRIGTALGIQIVLGAATLPNTGSMADFDNVRLVSVPEPAAVLLVALCFANCARRPRRSLYQLPHVS